MGRIINETEQSTIADADFVLTDNATSGSKKTSGANLKTQFEVTARKGVASGYCGLDSDNLVPATHLRPAFTIEEVADATARDALTITSGEVGKRLVRLTSTGVIYLANATGSGSSKWTTFNSMASATTSAQGVVELATEAEARTGTSESLALTPKSGRAGASILRNSLATRQALFLDGAGGCSVANQPAFGTGDFTVAVWLNPKATSSLGKYIIAGTADHATLFRAAGGRLEWYSIGALITNSAAGDVLDDKWQLVSVVRTGGTTTMKINGTTVGSAADSANITNAITKIGSSVGGGSIYVGGIVPLIYNRALSAAELLSLYETGAPAVADFNDASSTSLFTGDNSTFASDTGYWTKGAGVSIASGKLSLAAVANGVSAISRSSTSTLRLARKYRVTYTVSNYSAGAVFVQLGTSQGAARSANGTYTEELTCAGVGSFFGLVASGTTTLDVDDFTIVPLGLVLAPAQNAPGNGYQWKDMSGNKADITLPTSGAEWALPDRRPNSVRGTLTWSGTHESKSLLGQRALPDGAVLTLLTRKSTVASSGTGCTIGTTNSATRWQAADTFTTAKEVATIANQLPAGTADADNDIVVDPDSANITGSIEVEAHYVLTQPN